VILETAAAIVGAVAAAGGGVALRARSKRKAAQATAQVEAAAKVAATPVKLAVTNGGRAVLALWLAYRPWKGAEAEERQRLFEAFALAELPAHRTPEGALIGLHLPIDMPGLPHLKGPAAAIAETLRAHDCERRRAEEAWMGGRREVELAPALAAMALRGLEDHPVPANLGPAAAELIRQLRGLSV